MRQIKERRFMNRKNARRRIPVPVLPVVNLHSAQDFCSAEFPASVVIEERLIFRNDIIVMSRRPTDRERTPPRYLSTEARHEFFRFRSPAPVNSARHAGPPVRCPLRGETQSFIVIGISKTKEVSVRSHPHLLPGFAAQRKQPCACLRIFCIPLPPA